MPSESVTTLKRRASEYALIGRKRLLAVRRRVDLHTGLAWDKKPHPEMTTEDWQAVKRDAEIAQEQCRAIAAIAGRLVKATR